jgi:riboflavin synthase
MFTGLIESKGVITRTERISGGVRLEVYAPDFGRDMAIGDSVAVDGVCLTITRFQRGSFLADVSAETLSRSTLGQAQQGTPVNLERALRMSDRFGGHFVSGHVDGIGRLRMRQPAGNSTLYLFSVQPSVLDYVVPKGSIAVDGISLTVADLTKDGFAASVIPHTEESTTLKDKPIGASVNLEADMIAKYIARYVGAYIERPSEVGERKGSRLAEMLRELSEGSR